MNKFGSLSSSVNPNKLGATVEGLIMGGSVFIIFLAHQAGLNIGSAEVSVFAVQVGSIVSTSWFLFGAIRKIVVWIRSLLKGEVLEDSGAMNDVQE